MVRSEQGRKSLLEDDIAVAAHTDLKPITRFFDSGGHDFDEGVLRQALLAKQQAELCAAQQEGWIPPLGRLGSLLPCFAPPEGGEEQPQGALSTATSGLTTMDTDEGSGELEKAATAAAAALASQEELEAAAAAAEAARQARREQRRAEKERRRQQLLQEKKEAKTRARAEARRRFADQQQRWEAATADKRQQVAELHEQAAEAGESIRAAEERAKELEAQKHALFLKLKQALDEEQAEKQRRQQLAAMEEGEVAISPPAVPRGAGATALPAATVPGAGAVAVPAISGGGGVRSPTYQQQYGSGGLGPVGGFGPLGGPRAPPEPAPGFGSGGAGGYGGGSGSFYGRCGPAAGPAGEFFDDTRTRDAWGTGGSGGGSATGTPRGPREGLAAGPAGGGFGGGGTPLAGERERDRGDFSWPRDFRVGGGPPGGSSREWVRRGSFEEPPRRPPPRDYSRDYPPSGGGASRDGLGAPSLSRDFGSSGRDAVERRDAPGRDLGVMGSLAGSSRDGLGGLGGAGPLPPRDFSASRGEYSGGGASRDGPPPRGGFGLPLSGAGAGPGGPAAAGRPRLTYEERERLRQQQREGDGGAPLDRGLYGGGSGGARDPWEHGSRDGGGNRDTFDRPGGYGGGSRDGFPAGFGRGGRGREWGPGGGAGSAGGGPASGAGREREREGGGGSSGLYSEPPRGR